MSLYHRNIGFPAGVQFPSGVLKLRYSQHALGECERDRYGAFEPPLTLEVGDALPVEIEIENGCVVKLLYRAPFDDEFDVVLAVKPDGFVKTVWLNKVCDCHRTLDRSKYTKP